MPIEDSISLDLLSFQTFCSTLRKRDYENGEKSWIFFTLWESRKKWTRSQGHEGQDATASCFCKRPHNLGPVNGFQENTWYLGRCWQYGSNLSGMWILNHLELLSKRVFIIKKEVSNVNLFFQTHFPQCIKLGAAAVGQTINLHKT